MPLYEYENRANGVCVQLPFSVQERPEAIVLQRAGDRYHNAEHDVTVQIPRVRARQPRALRLVRRSVPSRIMVSVGAQPPTMSDKMRAGYKLLEDCGQLKDNPNYLPASTIKKALEMPTV